MEHLQKDAVRDHEDPLPAVPAKDHGAEPFGALPDVLERLAARGIDTVQVAADLDEQDRGVEGADLVPGEALHDAEAPLAAELGLHVTRRSGQRAGPSPGPAAGAR